MFAATQTSAVCQHTFASTVRNPSTNSGLFVLRNVEIRWFKQGISNNEVISTLQAILSVHRARQGFVKARTAQANQIRGLLAEYGITIAQGIGHIAKRVPEILRDGENDLPGSFRLLIQRLLDHLKELDRQVGELEAQIQLWHRDTSASQKLAKIPGIGPMTASAMVASIGDARNFKNGRQLAAWLGIVPRQYSTGGKSALLGISKRRDTFWYRGGMQDRENLGLTTLKPL